MSKIPGFNGYIKSSALYPFWVVALGKQLQQRTRAHGHQSLRTEFTLCVSVISSNLMIC